MLFPVFGLKNFPQYAGVSKSFWPEYDNEIATINTRSEATQRFIAAKFTILSHKIAIQLHLVAESCTICNSRPHAASPKTFGYTFVLCSRRTLICVLALE
jgi:hypothetical protein